MKILKLIVIGLVALGMTSCRKKETTAKTSPVVESVGDEVDDVVEQATEEASDVLENATDPETGDATDPETGDEEATTDDFDEEFDSEEGDDTE